MKGDEITLPRLKKSMSSSAGAQMLSHLKEVLLGRALKDVEIGGRRVLS